MPSPDCVVYVDGNRIADDYDRTGDPAAAGEPALLSGLTVRWGRDTTVDQPEPGTATMTLLDPPGGQTFAQLLRVGAALTIEATGPAWSETGPGEEDTLGPSTITYGSFDSPSFPYDQYVFTNGAIAGARDTAAPFAGAASWRLSGPGNSAFLPGARAAPSDPPGSWDGIPRWGAAANEWTLELAHRSWHARTFAYPVFVTSPAQTGFTVGALAQLPLPPTDGSWAAAAATYVLRPAFDDQREKWLAVVVYVIAPTWDDPLTVGPTWADADCTWEQCGRIDLDAMTLRPDVDNTGDTTVLVFAGRITDVSVSLEDDQPVIELTAADLGAELANRVIGDVPWAASTALVRTQRILAAAGGGVTLFVDPGARAVPLSYVDVDARSTLELLQEVAASVDGVLWTATHPTTGPYLRLEHAASRAPLFRLQTGPGGLLVVVPAAGARVAQISACDLLAAPARFVQDVADVVNVVSVRWLEQTLDDDGKPAPTERAVIASDAPMIAQLGTRRLSLGTILASAAAAQIVAAGILARTDTTDYRVSGLALLAGELTERDQQLVTRLLDGTARNGLPLVLVDLPDWSPAGDAASLYLEGGTYSYVGGRWSLDLVVSSAGASGVGLPWNKAGAYRWADFAPATAWRSLAGVQPVDKLATPDPLEQ